MINTESSALIKGLISLPSEAEWVEFKHNRYEPEELGEYISALANSAALVGKDMGFIVWGIENGSHQVLGTTFKPHSEKVQNQELESWLSNYLSPILGKYSPF